VPAGGAPKATSWISDLLRAADEVSAGLPTIVQHVSMGGHTAVVEYRSSRLFEAISPALITEVRATSAAARLVAVEVPAEWLPGTELALAGRNDQLYAESVWGGGSVMITDVAQRCAWLLVASGARLTVADQATPFRSAFALLFPDKMLIHAAVLGRGQRAVLLAGPSGSGKSTLSLSCARAGMRFFGDDYCALQPPSGGDSHWTVSSLYAAGKFLPRGVAKPGRAVDPSGAFVEQLKTVVHVPDEAIPTGDASIIALVALFIDSSQPAGRSPMPRGRFVQRLAPNTALQAIHDRAAVFAACVALASAAPTYQLVLHPDDVDNVDEIRRLLDA
jgi:hypothetical protein